MLRFGTAHIIAPMNPRCFSREYIRSATVGASDNERAIHVAWKRRTAFLLYGGGVICMVTVIGFCFGDELH